MPHPRTSARNIPRGARGGADSYGSQWFAEPEAPYDRRCMMIGEEACCLLRAEHLRVITTRRIGLQAIDVADVAGAQQNKEGVWCPRNTQK